MTLPSSMPASTTLTCTGAPAARVLNVSEDAVNDQQRALGKVLNFGIVYGQTAYGLAEELGVPLPEAERNVRKVSAALDTRHPERRTFLTPSRGSLN